MYFHRWLIGLFTTFFTEKCRGLQVLTGLVLFFLAVISYAAVPALNVEGKHIKANGQVVSLSGMSLFWSNTYWGGDKFYNAGAISAVKNKFGANLLRVPMGVEADWGYLSEPQANEERVIKAVDAAIANDMYVIIDWHSHKAHQYKYDAIDFFKRMATKYGNKPNVIYEIYNEPEQVSWSNVIKPYAVDVIKEIRKIDPDNLIVVGTPQWSQLVNQAASDPITGYNNIAYTLHFYAGTHGQWLRDEALKAMNKNIALFVTEWGSVDYDGNGAVDSAESDRWVAFMKQHNLSNANWSLNDKQEGASALKLGASTTGNWTNSSYTASGLYAKNVISGWSGSTVAGIGKEYDWNSGSENVRLKQMTQSVSNGKIKLTLNAANNDPYMRMNSTNVDGDVYTVVQLRVRNATNKSNWKMYFNPNGHGEGGNSVNFSVPADGNWRTVNVAMTNDADWRGTIKSIRLDPQAYSSGTIEIDYVRVSSDGAASSDDATDTGSSSSESSAPVPPSESSTACQSYSMGDRKELNLSAGACITVPGGLAGKTVAVWDSDANPSCNFRGSVTSKDGSGSLSVSSNYASSNAFNGSKLAFNATNNCTYVKVRVY